MGFTRYWTVKKKIPQDKFDMFILNSKKIVEQHQKNGIKLSAYGDVIDDRPILDESELVINGVGEDAHESHN